jgi:hypothetical protein
MPNNKKPVLVENYKETLNLPCGRQYIISKSNTKIIKLHVKKCDICNIEDYNFNRIDCVKKIVYQRI